MSDRTSKELAGLARRLETWGDEAASEELRVEALPDLLAVAQAADAVTMANERLTTAVEAARQVGRGWGEIGRALGVTRQAARQRFGHLEPARVRPG